MFNRYKDQTIKKDGKTNVRYYKPSLYPDIPESDSDIIHTVIEGERLDLLAYRFYGDVGLWWIISRANRLNPSDISLKASTEIRIPQDVGSILQDLVTVNRD